MTLIFFALLGAAVGSFLNVCIDRLPRRQSLVRPGSHCDSCGAGLVWTELLPIISFLALRGRCRTCGTAISRRTPIVELLTAAIFATLSYHFGISLVAAILAFYAAVFIVILFVDLEHGIIPDRIVYPAAAAAILFSLALPEVGPLRAVLGGLIGFGVLLAIFLVARGRVGGGDVKLAGLIGVTAGFPLVVPALVLAGLAGGLAGVILLGSRRKGLRDRVPFGPCLVMGAAFVLFLGTGTIGAGTIAGTINGWVQLL